jgi:cytosine deaminase
VVTPAGTGGLTRLVLRGGRLADGRQADVAVDPVGATVAEVGPDLALRPGDVVEDCAGMVVLPAPAEPHAHLDKALLAQRTDGSWVNPVGDLDGAIAAMGRLDDTRSHQDLVDRATRAVAGLVAHGTTAIRSHVDVRPPFGITGLQAMLEVKRATEAAGLADVQLVALVSAPLLGPDGRERRALLDAALEAGVDVVGGCPYREEDPAAGTALLLDVAAAAGVPVDLHTDETLDASVLSLADLVRLIAERGPGAGVTASHCVSLGMQPRRIQAAISAGAAAAGVAIVTLPQTNLYLQGRRARRAVPRGLTALRSLLDAGAVLAAGADNVRDPFCLAGRLDAFETAALLIMAGHLSPDEAWAACSAGARSAMGLPAVTSIVPGVAAELLVAEGVSLLDAVGAGSERRLTIHRGRVVSRSEVRTSFYPDLSSSPDASSSDPADPEVSRAERSGRRPAGTTR